MMATFGSTLSDHNAEELTSSASSSCRDPSFSSLLLSSKLDYQHFHEMYNKGNWLILERPFLSEQLIMMVDHLMGS